MHILYSAIKLSNAILSSSSCEYLIFKHLRRDDEPVKLRDHSIYKVTSVSLQFLPDIEQNINAKVADLLNKPPFDAMELQTVQKEKLWRLIAVSEFAADVALKFPAYAHQLLLATIVDDEKSEAQYSAELSDAVAENSDFNSLSEIFRKYRNQQMLRIVWRDAILSAPVESTLRELSGLADACIKKAMHLLFKQFMQELGEPLDAAGNRVYPVIFAMGKLGASELNFSSDIDLIFTYSVEGEILGERKNLSHHQFFTQLFQKFIRLLSDNTAYGFVFRVDARLRPFGDSGSLALSFDAMEAYYERHGREWERYAFIKARPISEDAEAAKEIADRLRPFVYRRYLDFGAFASLREMKELIDKETKRKGNENNVKLGFGGIREIEFIGQAFQLIRGGRERRLQARGILAVLAILREQHLIPDYVYGALHAAYLFLRKTENAIQYYADQQTHLLPSEPDVQQRLAFALNYESWQAFTGDLQNHTANVHEHFEQIFTAPQLETFDKKSEDNVFANLWHELYAEDEAVQVLLAAGFVEPVDALKMIVQLREGVILRSMSEHGRKRLDHLMPLLLSAVSQMKNPMLCLPRVLRLIEAIAKRTAYIALLAENPMGLSQLVKLFDMSQWLVDLLVRNPLLLDELLDPRRLYEPMSKAQLAEELKYRIDPNNDDVEAQMRALVEFKQANTLRVAASELTGAMPTAKVSDHLTYIAEIILENVNQLVTNHLQARHGRPKYVVDASAPSTRISAGFCIIAYGKLGGLELGFGSDLDLVFLHDSHGSQQQTDGEKCIENSMYFARLGQRIIHYLHTRTQGGVLYEVDARLRPSGAAGLLVSSISSFSDYQHRKAWTWEHQALIRARPIVGSETLIQQFQETRKAVLTTKRDPEKLLIDVVNMRRRMRNELLKVKGDKFDLKQGYGGIAYIEF